MIDSWPLRRGLPALLAALAVPATLAGMATAGPAATPEVQCTLKTPRQGRIGQPVWLHIRLESPSAVQVLTWGTPFEGAWLAPFVALTRKGEAIPYRGAAVKRGEPVADDYLRLQPNQARQARIDLAQAFDLSLPGSYRLVPRLQLHDVVPSQPGAVPRPRSAHRPLWLACPALAFDLRPGSLR